MDFALFHTTYPCWLVYICGGRRFQNRGEVLLEYGRICFGAFKYQHRLVKFAWCTLIHTASFIT